MKNNNKKDCNEFSYFFKNLIKKVVNMPLQKSLGFGLVALFVVFATTVSAAIYASSKDAQLPSAGPSSSQSSSASQKPVAKPVELPKEPEIINLTMHGSSVEEDLEITVLDGNKNIVMGTAFEFIVTDKKGKSKEYIIDEKDGVLYIDKIAEGEYTIAMKEIDGFVIPEPITCKVNKKVVYKKIENIEEIIVDESKINVAEEDKSFNQQPAAPTEPVKDTVDKVESDKSEVTVTEKVTVTKYIPELDNGRLLYADGKVSPYYAVLENGYLKSAYYYKAEASALQLSAQPALGLGKATPMLMSLKANSSMILLGLDSSTAPQSSSSDSIPAAPSEGDGATASSDSASTSSSSDSESSSESSSDSSSAQQPSQSTGSSSDSSSGSGSSASQPQGEKIDYDILDKDGKIKTDSNGNPLFKVKSVEVETTIDKVETVYKGWQTINGKTYYYDKNGKKVTGWQIIDGVSYFFDTQGVRSDSIGIDVSKWQYDIDWHAVKASGINFAFIRSGYRGYGSGALVEDPYYHKNMQGAIGAGIKVGIYFFSQAVNAEEAVEEASMVLSQVRGYNLSYPIVFDTEYSSPAKDGRADALSQSQRTAVTNAFCETIRNSGYTPMVYASKSWFYYNLDFSQVSKYKIWLAHYTSQTDFRYKYDVWQYTSTGRVNGVGTAVDMNISYLGY